LHEQVPVFLIDLGPLDALLPASDFYGATAAADTLLEMDTVRKIPLLRVNGRLIACVRLERHFRALVGDSIDYGNDYSEAAAFLSRRAGTEDRAYLSDRPFEMRSFPLDTFRLPPQGLRQHLSRLGIAALRFSEDGRTQYVLNAHRLPPLPEDKRRIYP